MFGSIMTNEDPTSMSNTFEFSEADYVDIMLKDSIFDDKDTPETNDIESLMDNLQHLLQRETKQYFHAVTLSDYLRRKIIPRGLRLQKAPAFGLHNEEFCTRWCEILNKCSFDLMALVIKETTKQLETTKLEYERMEIQLGELVTKSKLTELKKELEHQRAELSKEIKMNKRVKFTRDMSDYQQSKVYFWKDGKTETKPQRTRTFIASSRGRRQPGAFKSWASSTSCDSDSDPAGRWRKSSPFLGRAQVDLPRKERRASRPRRNAEGANEKGNPLPPRVTRNNQRTRL